MPNNSLNTRVSAPSTSTLSQHSLDLLRPLLRGIALWHRERTRLVPLDPDLEFDDIADPDTPTQDELERTLNAPYDAKPTALHMPQDEIEAAIAAGQDPWAEAANTGGSSFLHQPPIANMLVAARFAALLSDAGLLSDVTTPRAFSMITIPDRAERKAAWKDIDNVLRRLADQCVDSDDTWRDFKTPVLAAEPNHTKGRTASQREDFEDAVEAAVRNGHKLLALTPDANSMSPLMRAMCGRVLNWPPLTGQMIIEMLRVTHTATGKLSEDAIVNLLPSDSEITALPLAVIESAFLEKTTLKVAQTLATAAKRFRTLPPSSTTLNDIVLNSDTRAPIERLIADIASWKARRVPWNEVSSSVLFYGPPGNGKTLLASALAGSLGVPLIATSYSDCQRHGHQGDMLKALSGKVEDAIRSTPCVFFLDELDSFTHRNRKGRNSDYIVGVVNGLLEHLTRLNDTAGVIVLGATNYPDMIDPAVVRPGRLDLKIEISTPDRASVLQILTHALGPDAKAMQLSPIADQILGSSGAQITALVREARGLARAQKCRLQQSQLEAAASRICPVLDPDILWRIAIHETGHLVVAHALGLPPAERATITNTGGFVDIPTPLLESVQSTKNRIAALLGGRAAEQIILGEALNGAGLGANSDLELATKLAGQMICEWGLGDQLAYTPAPSHFNDRTHHLDKMLKIAEHRAIQILTARKDLISNVAVALYKTRELSGEQIRELLQTGE
ncbi:AAA family ATPase [Epibacterium ulvae]|uniref:AAA family ATPase n=1 Tax=Epibacterium ulvae TaxID=1156985 RepID=UPI001BFCCEFC|nr:AAA family ATPase [Epibacterium ulvae]MBT8155150.1 AAA family ATPase [Epibacterium ulvae]